MKATSHISVTLLLFVALSCISRPASAKADASFIYSRSSTLTNALVNFDIKAGWRFNLF